MKHKKEIKGFLLAPLVPSAVFAIAAIGVGLYSGVKFDPFTFILGGLIWFISALPVAYAVTFLFGIPGFFFEKNGVYSLKAYLLGGLFLGLVAPVMLLVIFELKVIVEMGVWLFLPSTVFGAITSYSFWRMVIKSSNHALNQDAQKQRAC